MLKEFKSDGCTWWPDGPWTPCCIEHDRVYWKGGTFADRWRADRVFRHCVRDKGYPIMAWVMWAGVRIGGAGILYTKHRWGFSHTWPRSK